MMSKKCKYALKALIKLASHFQQGYLATNIIASDEQIPKKFLEQILLELKHNRFVNSKQGIGGGYYLLKSPEEISLADVYRLFDGPIALTTCASLNFYEKCNDCPGENECVLYPEMVKVREKTRKVMSETTLKTFLDNKKVIA